MVSMLMKQNKLIIHNSQSAELYPPECVAIMPISEINRGNFWHKKFKHVMRLSIVPFVLFSHLAQAQSTSVQTEPEKEAAVQNPALQQWGPSYPFGPDELRQKLMQVLRIPANDLSREKIESIFEMKMQNSDKLLPDSLNDESNHGKWYKVYSKATIDWYFSVGIAVVPKMTNFGFRWWNSGNSPHPYVVPMCVDIKSVLKDIKDSNLGWIEVMPDARANLYGPYTTHDFNHGKGTRMAVDYLPNTTCMTGFSFIVNTTNEN